MGKLDNSISLVGNEKHDATVLTELHTKVLDGIFGKVSHSEARQAYEQAILGTPNTPLSQELADAMDKHSVTVNQIIAFVDIAFADLQENFDQFMQEWIKRYSDVCKDFQDQKSVEQLINALKRSDLLTIEISLSAHHDDVHGDIGKLGKLPPTQRAMIFWKAIAEIADHRKSSHCDVTIEEINYVY